MDLKYYANELKKCSKDDKLYATQIINELLEAGHCARRKGLLALEKFEGVSLREYKLFKLGTDLVIDGTDPEYVRTILENNIVTGNYEGRDLLVRLLISDGIMEIQQGNNPEIIKKLLYSYLGEEYWKIEAPVHGIDHIKNDLVLKMTGYTERYSSDESVIEFEKIMGLMDKVSIQRVIRDIRIDDLVRAIHKIDPKVQLRIIEVLSQGLIIQISNELNIHQDFSLDEVICSQRAILKVIEILKKQGEII